MMKKILLSTILWLILTFSVKAQCDQYWTTYAPPGQPAISYFQIFDANVGWSITVNGQNQIFIGSDYLHPDTCTAYCGQIYLYTHSDHILILFNEFEPCQSGFRATLTPSQIEFLTENKIQYLEYYYPLAQFERRLDSQAQEILFEAFKCLL